MTAAGLRIEEFNITEEDLAGTPPPVRKLLFHLAGEVSRLRKRLEELEAKLGEDSSNSDRPPSSDSPYKERQTEKRTTTPQKNRRGYRQEFMPPTETREIFPSVCSCGCNRFKDLRPYYTHQQIELPEIVMQAVHSP